MGRIALKLIPRGPPPSATCERAYGWAAHAFLTLRQTPLPPLFALLNGRFSHVNSSTWYNVEFVVIREREQPSWDGGDFELKGEMTLPVRWPSEKEGARDCLSIAEI
jgi:hypothetical protein